jgi:hypothetical protein
VLLVAGVPVVAVGVPVVAVGVPVLVEEVVGFIAPRIELLVVVGVTLRPRTGPVARVAPADAVGGAATG